MVQSFISAIIMLLNFDLLESFEWAQVPIVPSETLAKELTPSLGFIEFDSCAAILNINTLIWLIIAYFVQIFVLFPLAKMFKYRFPKSIKKKINEAESNIFWEGFLSNID